MRVKVAEVSRTDQNLGLLLESIGVDTELDAFGQSTLSTEIHIEDRYAFEEAKNRSQRVFVAKDADVGTTLAICFAYPVLMDGRYEPRVGLMLRSANPMVYPTFRPGEALKVDLRVHDPKLRGAGIGYGFASKVLEKYLLAPGTSYSQILTVVDRDDDRSVSFATKFRGRVLAEQRGKLLFLFDFAAKP